MSNSSTTHITITPVILSGGSGSRLWPLSRKLRPKQFLPVVGEDTLFQATLNRLHGLAGLQAPLVVCNEDHRFMVAEQLRALGESSQGILLEPAGRNTAPAITLAALYAQRCQATDTLLLVLPADHVIADIAAFQQAVLAAIPFAKQGNLVTFGIVPQRAETGYGYIQHDGNNRVLRFVEKPNATIAEEYVRSGEYWWNSGMFLFQADTYLDTLAQYQPTLLGYCTQALVDVRDDGDFVRVAAAPFQACPSLSVDYAVMEKASNVAVIPLDAGWSDVGAWSAVWEAGQQDAAGNVLRGDVLVQDAHHNLVYSEQRLVAVLGVDNLVVVDTKDATLVAHRDKVQDVKLLVEQLQSQQRPEALLHREVFRPWGSYDCIDGAERYQVKRITVNPGEKLSLQMHYHRAEHWIVVRGTAEVRCGDKTMLLTENQSTYIPLGEVHSLANPGKVPLEIIEVQSGSYLGEDDIVRFEDRYGRIAP